MRALSAFLLGALAIAACAAAPSFTIEGDRFVRDGVPLNVMSGELHYARIPRAYWRDRLQRLRAMANTNDTPDIRRRAGSLSR